MTNSQKSQESRLSSNINASDDELTELTSETVNYLQHFIPRPPNISICIPPSDLFWRLYNFFFLWGGGGKLDCEPQFE